MRSDKHNASLHNLSVVGKLCAVFTDRVLHPQPTRSPLRGVVDCCKMENQWFRFGQLLPAGSVSIGLLWGGGFPFCSHVSRTRHTAEHCRAFEPFAKHNRLVWHAHSALPRDTTERIICVSIPALCGVVWSVVFLCKRHSKQKTAGQWAKH